jgi:hypothetical protein
MGGGKTKVEDASGTDEGGWLGWLVWWAGCCVGEVLWDVAVPDQFTERAAIVRQARWNKTSCA